mgnify:CR=1 FL=1
MRVRLLALLLLSLPAVVSAADGEQVFVQSVRYSNQRDIAAALRRWATLGSVLGLMLSDEDEEADDEV